MGAGHPGHSSQQRAITRLMRCRKESEKEGDVEIAPDRSHGHPPASSCGVPNEIALALCLEWVYTCAWQSVADAAGGPDLAVPEFFQAVEQSGLSTWLRESDSVFAFYFILLCHTLGLALLVGANTIVDLRLLGVPSDLPLKPLREFFFIMWLGFAINAISGVFLVIAFPTKAFTNPDFYIKLMLITLAVITMQRIKSRVFDDLTLSDAAMIARGKTMAKLSLGLWIGAITAGRLLAYTYTYRLYGEFK